MTAVSLLFIAAATPPVVAERPSPTVRPAAVVVIRSGWAIQGYYRGMQAGLFNERQAAMEIQRESYKAAKHGAVGTFAVDKTLNDEEKTRRIYRWLLKRPPKPDELKAMSRYLKRLKNRHQAFGGLIMSLYSKGEFMKTR